MQINVNAGALPIGIETRGFCRFLRMFAPFTLNFYEMELFKADFTREEHRQAVAALINVYIKDEMGGGEPLGAAEQLRLAEGLGKHPSALVLLAATGGQYAGLLVAFGNFSTFAARPMVNIHDVIVHPN